MRASIGRFEITENRMARAWIAAWTVLLAGVASTPPASGAVEGERGGEAGVFAGVAFTDENLALETGGSVESALGVRGGSVFARRWTWFADFLAVRVSPTDSPVGDALTYWGRSGVELFLQPERDVRWFLDGAAGWMKTDFEDSSAADFDRSFISGSFGQHWRLGPRAWLRWEVRGDITVDDEGLANETVGQGLALVGVIWGPKSAGAAAATQPTDTDADRDGVQDGRDRCAGTPAGAVIDGRGCPLDGDRDGVPDGIDGCPDTPRGSPVGATGCPADADGDGVVDSTDACAATPPGARVDDWGCPFDRDRDRIPDGLDRCPDTRPGALVDAAGCPLDADGDMVPDGIDQCPDTPPGTTVDERGCPEVGFEFDSKRQVLVLWLAFQEGSASMSPAAPAVLDGVAEILASTPGRFEIGGHADPVADGLDALALSVRRAEAVRNALVDRGTEPSRLTTRGYGDGNPLSDGDAASDRRRNRRIELRLLEPSAED
jgi:OOP family OmpA-OmpF porin